MKNRIIKNILVLVMAFFAIPIFAQDAVVVFFKDGNFRKFYLRDIVEISTSQYDEYGTAHSDYQYQHIITKSEKFVYDLSNINSIGFSKYDDAKAEQNFVEAMPKVANALSDCETISDAESQIDQIKEQQGVEDAWSDGHQLYVKIEEGETFSFHFDHSVEIDGDWMESGDYQNFAKAMASKAKRANASVNSQVKVVVANQQHYDESRVSHTTDFLEPLLQAFRDCGFVADYVKDPTVDFFYDNSSDSNNLHIYDYDIILLVTHGAYLEPKYLASKGGFWRDFHEEVANYDLKCHAIMTSEVIDNLPIKGAYDDKWKECYAKFKAWRDESQFQNVSDIDLSFEFMKEERGGENRWIAHPVLTEYFFRHIATGRFHDNSILFNTACQSLLSDGGPEIPSYSFANEFFDKNLSLYAGYTEENFLGTDVMAMFLKNMLNYGQSIGFVYDDLPKAFKKESIENIKNSSFLTDKTRQKIYDDGGPKDAELLILPDGNIETRLRFLFGVYTNEKDQSSVTQEFNTDKAVTISSTLTANKPKYINAGFYYGTDVNNLSENVEASFKRNIDNQGKGNCEFVATLTNLEPGKTYFYRAYTFDGMNYNYGEPCSFEISGGETNITEGLVAYYPFNGNANDASGYGNHGILSGNNPPALTTDRHGRENSAYSFGGFKNYNWIKVPNSESLKFDKEMTISFWIQQSELAGMDGWGNYSTTSPSFAVICKAGDGIATYPGLYILTGKGKDGNGLKISNNISNGVLSIGYNKSDYQLGNWLHIVLVVNKSDKILYVDGIEVAHDQLNKENIFSSMNAQDLYFGIMASSNMTLGRYGSGAWYPFYGKIDDIRFYNRALDPSEISVLYNE